jgi:preprotein translocase subunit SecB
MSVDRLALDEAKKCLLIRDVYFRDEAVRVDPSLTPHFAPETGRNHFKMTTSIAREFTVDHPENTGRFIEIAFTGIVRCTAAQVEGEQEKELLVIEVTLGLLYAVKSECPQESVDEFVRVNAPYHAIPYWREHVHSVCCKRRFRPVTVPLYTRLASQLHAAEVKAAS